MRPLGHDRKQAASFWQGRRWKSWKPTLCSAAQKVQTGQGSHDRKCCCHQSVRQVRPLTEFRSTYSSILHKFRLPAVSLNYCWKCSSLFRLTQSFFFFWKILTFPFSRCHWNFEDIYIQFKVKLRHSGASSPFMWVSGSELEVLSLYRTTTKAESSSFEILTEKKARKMIAVKVNKELKKVLRWFSQKHQQSR